MTASTRSDYAFVTDMFRHLDSLDENSSEFRRQRDEIIDRCLPLADHIARRFAGRGEPLEDLVQVARIGLINAVNRFDVDHGTDFLPFAVPTIMGEVRRYFRDFGWAVSVPRRLKDLQYTLNQARSELYQQIGRAPTATELANHVGIDRETVVESTIAGSSYAALSTDYTQDSPDDDHQSLAETLGDLDTRIATVLDVETARPLIAALPERHKTVLTLRFFANMTQTEIAERLGCSQMHVSRMLAQTLHTLRSQVCEDVRRGVPVLTPTAQQPENDAQNLP